MTTTSSSSISGMWWGMSALSLKAVKRVRVETGRLVDGSVRTSSSFTPLQQLLVQCGPVSGCEVTGGHAAENSDKVLIESEFRHTEVDQDFFGRRPSVRQPATREFEDRRILTVHALSPSVLRELTPTRRPVHRCCRVTSLPRHRCRNCRTHSPRRPRRSRLIGTERDTADLGRNGDAPEDGAITHERGVRTYVSFSATRSASVVPVTSCTRTPHAPARAARTEMTAVAVSRSAVLLS